jgi:hypothetical protein
VARKAVRLVWACLAVAATACGVERDPIATEGASASPFMFPYVDQTVPGAPGQFGGGPGDPAGAPKIVYPLDGAMHAVNIGDINFQWTRGSPSNRVFRIRLDDGQTRYDFYVPCTIASCLYALPARGWLAVA